MQIGIEDMSSGQVSLVGEEDQFRPVTWPIFYRRSHGLCARLQERNGSLARRTFGKRPLMLPYPALII